MPASGGGCLPAASWATTRPASRRTRIRCASAVTSRAKSCRSSHAESVASSPGYALIVGSMAAHFVAIGSAALMRHPDVAAARRTWAWRPRRASRPGR